MKAFSEGPNRILRLTQDLTEKDYRARPISGKWSIAEILIHLADAEIVGACRFRQAYCEHPGEFPYYDQAKWAVDMNYQNFSANEVDESLQLFKFLRSTTSTLLNECTERDWAKSGVHTDRGPMSLRELLELYADHSERHIEQILERRKLIGKEITMEIILTDRLY